MNDKKLVGKINRVSRKYAFVSLIDEYCFINTDDKKLNEKILNTDIFVDEFDLGGAMDGDIVEVDLIPEYLWKNKPEGIVDKIVKRCNTEIVGTLCRNRGIFYVEPISKEFKDFVNIKKKDLGVAYVGDIVNVLVTEFPKRSEKAYGKVCKIISKKNDVGGYTKALIEAKGLHEKFPHEVKAETQNILNNKNILKELDNRIDLRAKNIITIDGLDAKDLDDAISIEKDENDNYVLGVHIADVSFYVPENSKIDIEAFDRGNSVYLLNKVIPMLPEEFSNGVCSLNPKEDKLTLTCEMVFNKKGEIQDYSIFSSVICSKARMNYDGVSDILELDDFWVKNKYHELHQELLMMEELANILYEKRRKEGSLDFNIVESEITLDENEKPIDVGPAERRVAHRIIEEFMLSANRTIAQHFYWLNLPFVYRVHEKPDETNVSEAKKFLFNFGLSIKGGTSEVHPKSLQTILGQVKDKPFESLVNTIILRSMKKAYYSQECKGHFGLAFKYYCHFTSPIRRYPDLMVHRLVKKYLNCPNNNFKEEVLETLNNKTHMVSEHCSKTERTAEELERDIKKIKKAEYMKNYIGYDFEGIVSGVTEYGMYVELPNTIEGMIRINSIPGDYFDYDEKNYRLVGRRTGKCYTLGQKVEVVVLNSDPTLRQIDFELKI